MGEVGSVRIEAQRARIEAGALEQFAVGRLAATPVEREQDGVAAAASDVDDGEQRGA
jgi:hypothetical protein